MPTINHPMKFKLRRYDSDVGLWKSMAVSVHEPAERGRLLPITHTPREVLFHCTTKVITLGNAAVGWVDLWRGILLCDDVLDQHPVLRDLLLPKPVRSNRKSWIKYVQDTAPSCIKYVEMVTRPGDPPPRQRRRPPQHSEMTLSYSKMRWHRFRVRICFPFSFFYPLQLRCFFYANRHVGHHSLPCAE
jgi:hypothetical protein